MVLVEGSEVESTSGHAFLSSTRLAGSSSVRKQTESAIDGSGIEDERADIAAVPDCFVSPPGRTKALGHGRSLGNLP
jgi:hypothetical protein